MRPQSTGRLAPRLPQVKGKDDAVKKATTSTTKAKSFPNTIDHLLESDGSSSDKDTLRGFETSAAGPPARNRLHLATKKAKTSTARRKSFASSIARARALNSDHSSSDEDAQGTPESNGLRPATEKATTSTSKSKSLSKTINHPLNSEDSCSDKYSPLGANSSAARPLSRKTDGKSMKKATTAKGTKSSHVPPSQRPQRKGVAYPVPAPPKVPVPENEFPASKRKHLVRTLPDESSEEDEATQKAAVKRRKQALKAEEEEVQQKLAARRRKKALQAGKLADVAKMKGMEAKSAKAKELEEDAALDEAEKMLLGRTKGGRVKKPGLAKKAPPQTRITKVVNLEEDEDEE